MKHKNVNEQLTTVFLLLFLLFSFAAESQNKNDLVVYKSTEQMVAAAKEVVTEITVKDFKNTYTRDDIFIIDVRSSAENEEGAVPGAVNIPRGVLEFRVDQAELWEKAGKNPPKKSDPVFVYCSTGGRGALSAKALMQLGYKNVESLQGGWNAWNEAYPEIKE
jgi:rhodanese-related sulfurtransferase